MLLDTTIKLIGPNLPNKDHHCLEKCVVSYEYPAYILASFSKFFYRALTIDMLEARTNTINIYSVCSSAEEFHSLNILINGSYTLDNITYYFVDCIKILDYLENTSIANIVFGLFTIISQIEDNTYKYMYTDPFTTLRATFGLIMFGLVSENDEYVVKFIIFLINTLSDNDRKNILKYMTQTLKIESFNLLVTSYDSVIK